MLRVAINGFGRIGMGVARAALQKNEIQITHINDICDFKNLIYILQNDSIFGAFKIGGKRAKIEFIESKNELFINGQKIKLSNKKSPRECDFGDVDVVLEVSGAFLDSKNLKNYLKNGAQKVILSAPPSDEMPIFIMGVNEKNYRGERIFSNASCTSNAIAPIIHAILQNRAFSEIIACNITTIHPSNNDQALLDTAHSRTLRLNRNASLNIIPISSSVGRVLECLFSELQNKVYGDTARVPTSLVSFSNIDLFFKNKIKKSDILALKMDKKIIGFDYDMRVSSDFIGEKRSAVIASDLIFVRDNFARIPIWFDNESGYTQRLYEMALLAGKK